MTFQGSVISEGRCIPDPCRVEMVKNLPLPQSVTALKSWLGLEGFCRDFTENFSDLAKPLYYLLKEKPAEKDSIVHMDASLSAFDKLKVANAPTLKSPDKSKPFILEVDASDTALSAVLLKEWNEVLKPVTHASRLMSAVEITYDSPDTCWQYIGQFNTSPMSLDSIKSSSTCPSNCFSMAMSQVFIRSLVFQSCMKRDEDTGLEGQPDPHLRPAEGLPPPPPPDLTYLDSMPVDETPQRHL
ncbi:hypothetical protein AOLI_G00089740 [Acnodon oligacanthus]